MTESFGEEREDEVQYDEAAEAFVALRDAVEAQGLHLGAEITVIRKGVEAAFEQFEKFQQPTDYSEDLAIMAQAMTLVVERIQAIEKSPILRNGPEHYSRMMERSAESAMRIPVTQLDNESRNLRQTIHAVEGWLGNARQRYIQNRYLGYIGVAGFLAGVLLTLLLPRISPGLIAPQVASFVMAEAPWRAGMDLMSYASPEGVKRVADADQLAAANNAEIAACREAATKAGKEQKCLITVSPER